MSDGPCTRRTTYPVRIRLVNLARIVGVFTSRVELLSNFEEVLPDVRELAAVGDAERSRVAVDVVLSWRDLVGLRLRKDILIATAV